MNENKEQIDSVGLSEKHIVEDAREAARAYIITFPDSKETIKLKIELAMIELLEYIAISAVDIEAKLDHLISHMCEGETPEGYVALNPFNPKTSKDN